MSLMIKATATVGPVSRAVELTVHPHHSGGVKIETGVGGSLVFDSQSECAAFAFEFARVLNDILDNQPTPAALEVM